MKGVPNFVHPQKNHDPIIFSKKFFHIQVPGCEIYHCGDFQAKISSGHC